MVYSFAIVAVWFAVLALAGSRFVPQPSAGLSALLGIVFWSVLSWGLTLFGPFAFLSLPVMLALALFSVNNVQHWKRSTLSWRVAVWLILLVALVSYAADLPLNFDTGAYHMQHVQWLSTFGVVPGIANLDPTLGLYSAWFSTAASFEIGPLKGTTYHFLNLLPWLAALLLLLEAIKPEMQLSDVAALFMLPMVLFFARSDAASVSPDLPAFLLAFGAILSAIKFLEGADARWWRLCAFLSVGAFAMKLSMAPMVLLAPALAFSQEQLTRKLLLAYWKAPLALLVVIAAAMLSHNYVLTGWPLFPSVALHFDTPDWQVPKDNVLALVRHIRLWGIRNDYENLPEGAFFAWAWDWILRNRSIHMYPVQVYGLLALFPVLLTYHFTVSAETRARFLPIFAILGTGLVYWLVSSPNPRFGTVWVVGLNALAITILVLFRLSPQAQRAFRISLMLVAVYFLIRLIPESGIRSRVFGEQSYLISLMRPAPQGPVIPYTLHDGSEISVPEQGFRVFNAPIPAARRGPVCVERRSVLLKDGFRVNQACAENPEPKEILWK